MRGHLRGQGQRGYAVSAVSAGASGDLTAQSPHSGARFLVKVHGFRRRNEWILKPSPAVANLYYVLALVPADAPRRFFVMSQQQVLEEIERQRIRLGRSRDYNVQGFNFSTGERYKDCWATLPH
jgi:hypothetical protein